MSCDHSFVGYIDRECFHCGVKGVEVPAEGTYIVTDGRVLKAAFDTQGYAGPQVHLMVTEEPM